MLVHNSLYLKKRRKKKEAKSNFLKCFHLKEAKKRGYKNIEWSLSIAMNDNKNKYLRGKAIEKKKTHGTKKELNS
jgi:hypothetical protein